MGRTNLRFLDILIDFSLLIGSVILFGLSFPSMVYKWGFFPLGFIALIPAFILIHRSGWVRIFIYGLLYGFLCYSFFNFWLLKFHPLAIFIVPTIYAVYFLILFPLLKLADTFFPKYGFLVQLSLWIGYEYLRTKGFLGYSYGIMGYSQFLFLPLARVSSLLGVWGVSLLVVFPSVYIGNGLKNGFGGFRQFLKSHSLELYLYTGVLAAAVLFGVLTKTDLTGVKQWRVACIQQNVDPWKYDYDGSLKKLINLSKEAAKENPDIVVWSETAFVPAIEYHTRHRDNEEVYELVKQLISFLHKQPQPYIIGNDDGQLEMIGGKGRVDYNAALLFKNGNLIDRYWKTHLVPFTENFPFEKRLPGIYNMLINADTHFWEKGDEYTVFDAAGVKFSTPICFEDTFGYLSRNFVRNGAEVIVNLTNDSWSFSVAAEMQHMSMAVFRALENKRSVVRSTNGGITCVIDPNGKIISILPPFIEDYLVTDVPVYTDHETVYTKWGDWFGIIMAFTGGLFLLLGILLTILRKKRQAEK